SEDDAIRLVEIWSDLLGPLRRIQSEEKGFTVRMLGGSQIGYIKATRRWWAPIESLMQNQGVGDRPVYFISSNTHSLVNLLSGSARRHQQEIVDYIERSNNLELVPELRKLRQGQSRGNWDNFLYYAARSYYGQSPEAGERREAPGRRRVRQGRHSEWQHRRHHDLERRLRRAFGKHLLAGELL